MEGRLKQMNKSDLAKHFVDPEMKLPGSTLLLGDAEGRELYRLLFAVSKDLQMAVETIHVVSPNEGVDEVAKCLQEAQIFIATSDVDAAKKALLCGCLLVVPADDGNYDFLEHEKHCLKAGSVNEVLASVQRFSTMNPEDKAAFIQNCLELQAEIDLFEEEA